MNFIQALAATVNARRLARYKGLRDGCGYFVADDTVYWYDRTELSADLRTPVIAKAHWLPAASIVLGDGWEVVER